jgi:hypothetical protein
MSKTATIPLRSLQSGGQSSGQTSATLAGHGSGGPTLQVY